MFQKHGTPMGYRPYPTSEHLLVYRKHSDKTIDSNIRKRSLIVRSARKVKDPVEMGDVWHIQPVKNKNHPAVFPDDLAERVIKLYSFKGDTVLDPFLGSGTTCRASKKLGRKCIGIEKKGKYHETARKELT